MAATAALRHASVTGEYCDGTVAAMGSSYMGFLQACRVEGLDAGRTGLGKGRALLLPRQPVPEPRRRLAPRQSRMPEIQVRQRTGHGDRAEVQPRPLPPL